MMQLVYEKDVLTKVSTTMSTFVFGQETADYVYNPFFNSPTIHFVCNEVANMAGSDELVADLTRLRYTGTTCRVRPKKEFKEFVTNNVLRLPDIKSTIIVAKRAVRAKNMTINKWARVDGPILAIA